jgi:hypothetical protein
MTAHNHRTIVPGCYRCELSMDEYLVATNEQIDELARALERMVITSGHLTTADGSSDALFLLLDARTAACELLGIDPTQEIQ